MGLLPCKPSWPNSLSKDVTIFRLLRKCKCQSVARCHSCLHQTNQESMHGWWRGRIIPTDLKPAVLVEVVETHGCSTAYGLSAPSPATSAASVRLPILILTTNAHDDTGCRHVSGDTARAPDSVSLHDEFIHIVFMTTFVCHNKMFTCLL
jgi:hypothetical protein